MEDLRTVAMEYQRSLTENLDQFYVVRPSEPVVIMCCPSECKSSLPLSLLFPANLSRLCPDSI